MIASPQQLAHALHELLHAAMRRAMADATRVLAEVELSFTQVKALNMLEAESDLTVKEVATRLSLSLPAVSRSIDALVQRGFVAREEHETDRRSRRLSILPPGRAALKQVTDARLAGLEEFASLLSEEERTQLYAAILPIVERTRPR